MRFEEFAECEIIDLVQDVPVDVTIYCLTYNHGKYIKDALDGFVNQMTNYTYEIVIFDDASTDGAADIIRDYSYRYPHLFRTCLAHRNTFGLSERKELFRDYLNRKIHGKYIIECEGDDYWNSCNKLQKQVDILEHNPNVVMVTHNSIWLDCINQEMRLSSKSAKEGILGPEDFICKQSVDFPTASLMFRKENFYPPRVLVDGFTFNDYQQILAAALAGDIYYIPEIMSVYRWGCNGSWSFNNSLSKKNKLKTFANLIELLDRYDSYSEFKYSDYIDAAQTRNMYGIVNEVNRGGELLEDIDNEVTRKIFDRSLEVLSARKDFSFAVESIRPEVSKYKHIYVMGAGKFGREMAKALDTAKIIFDGFVVSDTSDVHELLGKKVINIDTLSEEIIEDVCVIVAIDVSKSYLFEIYKPLREKGIRNVICPFAYKCYMEV